MNVPGLLFKTEQVRLKKNCVYFVPKTYIFKKNIISRSLTLKKLYTY